MLNRRLLFSCSLASLLGMPLPAQPVISARAGLIHLSEGAVLLDGQPIEPRAGKFEQMRDGSELRTRDGRAEVLLAPGAFLRIGQDTAIRMLSNRLADTRVEFLTGALILDAREASLHAPVTLVYQDYQIRIQQRGRYRFDSVPAELRVENGEADATHGSASISIQAGYVLPFWKGGLEARKFDIGTTDGLDQWDTARNGSIAENDSDAAQASDLAGLMDAWQNNPDAVLQALGMSSYLPSAGYTPLSSYSYTPLSNYSTYLGSPLGMTMLDPLGLRMGSTFGLYPIPFFRYSPTRSPLLGGSTYRGPYRYPGSVGLPRSPLYTGTPGRVGAPAHGTAVHGVHSVGHR